jgi:hypothetical protein
MSNINNKLIAHTGTGSSQRTKGFLADNYNIIDLDESTGRATVWLKIAGERGISMQDAVTKPPYFTGPSLPNIGKGSD